MVGGGWGERVALGGVGRDGGRLVELRWHLPKQGMLRSRGPLSLGEGGPWVHPGRGLGLWQGMEEASRPSREESQARQH